MTARCLHPHTMFSLDSDDLIGYKYDADGEIGLNWKLPLVLLTQHEGCFAL